jgi:lipid-A-disaccharide synthase
MRAAGMECWWDSKELAVFGLFEVIRHFRSILAIRKGMTRRLLDLKPDVFIGIDAPDFNLGLEKRLKAGGIRTVHYVSPTVWAWRAWRIPKIRSAADLVLCLFPFEPDFFAEHNVNAVYVGHPLADQIDPTDEKWASREALGLNVGGPVFALLPGSRQGEVERLAEPMLGAARRLRDRYPDSRFITALANERAADAFKAVEDRYPGLKLEAIRGKVRAVIAASDVVLCASGTVTLETLLINRPMVVAYKLAPATYWLARATRLVKAQRFALPNILSGEDLVPELIQAEASAARMAEEAEAWIEDGERRSALTYMFGRMHETLRCDASERAAEAVQHLLETK